MVWGIRYRSVCSTVLITIFIVLPALSPNNPKNVKVSSSEEIENPANSWLQQWSEEKSDNKSDNEFDDEEFDRQLKIYKMFNERQSSMDSDESTSGYNFGLHGADALSTFNGYLVGSLISQAQKLVMSNQEKSGTSCTVCKHLILSAKKLAAVSKELIPQVIEGLCDEEKNSNFANSKVCQQLPWNRQITVKHADSDSFRLLNKFKRGLEVRRAGVIDEAHNDSPLGHKHTKREHDEDEEDTKTIKSNFANDIVNILELMDSEGNDAHVFCYIFGLKSCPMPQFEEPNLDSWWPPKPKNVKAPEPCGETFNVLHLSDVHLQRHYQPGAEANCVGLMCCQPNSVYLPISQGGSTKNPQPAPRMGHYNCDTPETLFDSAMQKVATVGKLLDDGYDKGVVSSLAKNGTKAPPSLKPRSQDGLGFDFAIFTGDMVDHDSLRISYEDSVWEEENTLRKFKEYLGGMPVYSVLGNHDTYPYGQVAQHKSGYSNLFNWNTDLMIDLWREFGWLSDESNSPNSENEAFDSAREHYGGFAITTRQGLRVISLNSNFWYMWNLYNYWDTDNLDSSGTFKFLVDELVACEKNGQYAWIIAHVPPGGNDDESLPKPSVVFSIIVQRFSPHVITGIFFGHTHKDEFQLLYSGNVLEHVLNDGNDPEAVNVAWISQSITPLVNYNPGWRYYKVDKKTFSIMDSVNYYTNLEDTFEDNRDWAEWQYLYSARETYDVDGNWPEDKPLNGEFWSKVANSMQTDPAIIHSYLSNGYRKSPQTPACNDDECANKTYCYVTSFNTVQASECHKKLGLV